MVTAWVQLGETYTHLLPVAGRPDSLADDAFARALALDSSSAPVLLHPVESRLRRGDAAGAAPMLARFLAADPDPMLAAQLRLMDRCVRGGVGGVDWQGTVAAHPLAVLAAAQALAAGGAQLGCADGAYQALRTYETAAMAAADPDVDRRRWQALVGLQGVRVAAGRDSAAAALVDAAVASGEGGVPLILVQAPLAPAFAARGADAARRFTEQWGAGCARCPTAERAWHLGVWTAHRRDAAGLTALARLVAARADSTRLPADAVLARATAAHATLARGDSAAAVAGFAAVLAAPAPGGSELTWAAAAPHPAERLAYARLLLARRRFADAAAVADVFDSPAAQGYVPYLPASLALRAAAAESLGDPARAARYRRRLPPVGGTPVAIASRP
jgi:hypothetical protein